MKKESRAALMHSEFMQFRLSHLIQIRIVCTSGQKQREQRDREMRNREDNESTSRR